MVPVSANVHVRRLTRNGCARRLTPADLREAALRPFPSPAALPPPRDGTLPAPVPRLQAGVVGSAADRAVTFGHLSAVHVDADGVTAVHRLRSVHPVADHGVPLSRNALQDRADRLSVPMRMAIQPKPRILSLPPRTFTPDTTDMPSKRRRP